MTYCPTPTCTDPDPAKVALSAVAASVSTVCSSAMIGADSLVAAEAPTVSVTTTPLPIEPSAASAVKAALTPAVCDSEAPDEA